MIHGFAAMSAIDSADHDTREDHHVGGGNASADYAYGMSRSRFQVADEKRSGVPTPQCRHVGLPSQDWETCKPAYASKFADTDEAVEADGIMDCVFGADIFGML